MNPKTLVQRRECLPLCVRFFEALCAHSGNRGPPPPLPGPLCALWSSLPSCFPLWPFKRIFQTVTVVTAFIKGKHNLSETRGNITCQKLVSTLEESVKCSHVGVILITYMYNLINSGELEFDRCYLCMFEAVGCLLTGHGQVYFYTL